MPEFRILGPPGGKAKGLSAVEYPEAVRLSIFASDLRAAVELVKLADDGQRSNLERDAFCTAALIKVLGCFESTTGHRQRPLKSRKILDPAERKKLDDLKQIRNKMAVHDEQLYPMNSVVAVVMPDATVDSVWVSKATIPLHQVGTALEDLKALSQKLLERVEGKIEVELQQATKALNAHDLEWRKELLNSPDYSVNFESEKPEQARWKRENWR